VTGYAFRARYDGQCSLCGGSITPGDMIRFDDDLATVVHDDCDDTAETWSKPAPRMTCPTCHLQLPVTGMCGVCD
jgi:hypothetical protein